ncbi:ubiquinone biosynthesis O-methyltransferase, mitochondrial-like isoform X3 [Rhodamnia argentea]|uniref:Ubiquinone biosynthesis O-methyltransferase, mitochondrial-like isoform X3 n=1 Tax=Rhodamnia argentea TaxID=178133 RepID=A0ABM3HYW7_9MYRT|nr:ubiquinone biosynthesis O-methyltransferase, mitochondrial-like isoform X3 [Rhodamnia argentea]
MASKLLHRVPWLLHRVGAVSAPLKYPRTLSPTLAAFASLRLLSDVAPRPLPVAATGNSPPASTSPAPQFSGSSEKFEHNAKSSSVRSSLKDPELAKFSAIADTWWDSEGPFKPLHLMNPTRLAFIRSTLCRHFGKDPSSARPFEGMKIVDVGCGGGILSEPLARMGASVTGVDAVDKNIKIARIHADLDPVTSTIEYCCTTAEKLVEEQRKFDAVISLELPKGTHQWSSFLIPEELVLILQRSSICVKEMAGFVHNPLTGRWSLSDDISVNFIAFGTKKGQ